MNNLNTTSVDTRYFIIDSADPTKVLFSTMGGDKFFPHSEKNGEWQSRLWFRTVEDAERVIEEMYQKDRLLDRLLTVQREVVTTTVEYKEYVPSMNMDRYQEHLCAIQQGKFEEYMVQNSKYKLHELQRERTKMGYKNTELQEAFVLFVKLTLTIKR